MNSIVQLIKRKPLLSLVAVLLLIAIGIWYSRSGTHTHFITAPVSRGVLSNDISATGTLEPEEVIDVGAQVAGQILAFGTDTSGKTIDYRSKVEEGMVLARIDESLYQSDVAQAEAQLKKAQADLVQAQAKAVQAERDWKRAQKLGSSEALSPTTYDAYQATFESARANVTVAEAEIAQAQATLGKAQRNLGYCVIKSPVKGVIIDRRVNIGQTVVSSLNAPSLFLIAKDLQRMQVWVSVNEADIGRIYPGQKVTFSVDAFPNDQFVGEVVKVRLNASMTQNVVTYVVEVRTDNSSGKLLPYLTANVRFLSDQEHPSLLVPSRALKFKPAGKKAGNTEGSAVWVLRDGVPTRVEVKELSSDAVTTAVESSDLKEGENIIVAIARDDSKKHSASEGETTNPFAPTFRRGSSRH